MEVALPGPLALDCEDMFKEITKKLYGEEGALEFPDRVDQDEGSMLKPEDHITAFGLAALMQNGFPPPGILHANFQPKTNPAAEDKWSPSEESLQWTNSRIATYNPAQKLFKCVDCECVGFLSRIAEHWLGTHSNARVFQCPQCAYGSAWARCVRLHLVREHNMPDDRGTDTLVKNNHILDEVTKYLQRLKSKVDSMSPQPNQQGQNVGARTQTTSPPAAPGTAANKRYGCSACPYATDRRDLFTRHENIHRDEKPFECYVCQKQFNRADHVKKHFLRMHRDHPYDLNRIRRQIPKTVPTNYYPKQNNDGMNQVQVTSDQTYGVRQQQQQQQQHIKQDHNMHQIKSEHEPNLMSKHPKKKGEKRYTCCYCPWSGVDNWCLKRHLNTHLKPFVCALCDYKAARSERLATHVTKVHNKKACGKCSFLAEDQTQLTIHLQEQHHVENRNIKVPNTMLRAGYSGGPAAPVMPSFGPGDGSGASGSGVATVRTWRPPKQQGAARLFNYMEASDGSDQDDYEGKAYPTDERSVQDFPEAGDVGTAAEKVGNSDFIKVPADKADIVTSPAQIAKRPATKNAIPKKKKSGNKENKKSKFQCNICSSQFKTAKALSEHGRQHSKGAQRSPLLAANSDRNKFEFDEQLDEESQSSESLWNLDENGKHVRRSRKQSQPKKIILDEKTKNTLNTTDLENLEKNTNSEELVLTAPKTNSMTHIDQIISKIVKKKEIDLPEEPMDLVAELPKQTVIKVESRNRKIDRTKSKMILKKLKAKRKTSVILKCKRCQLKFKPNYGCYLHYRYCKSKRNKVTS